MQDATQWRVGCVVAALHACAVLGSGLPARMVCQHNGQHDSGRLHQRHGGGHVAAKCDAVVVKVLNGGDKGDCADRTIGGGNGC